MIFDAHGRRVRVRRVIGFFDEIRVEVEQPERDELEVADAIAAVDELDLDEPFTALEEC